MNWLLGWRLRSKEAIKYCSAVSLSTRISGPGAAEIIIEILAARDVYMLSEISLWITSLTIQLA